MSLRSRLVTWWRAAAHSSETAAQIDEELRFHIDSYAEDLMRAGLGREEALRRAKAELGSLAAARENTRQAWGTRAFDELAADLRGGLRMMRRNPGLAVIAVASLALGIGVNTAIFSMTNALLLEAMPVSHPEQLRLLEWQARHQFGYRNLPMGSLEGDVDFSKTGVATGTEFSYDEYRALRHHPDIFEGLAAYFHGSGAALQSGNALQHGTLEYVSPNFFQVLGIHAAIGRTIQPSDGASGGAPVVVLSDWLWNDLYARSRAAIGSTLEVNRIPLTIVGVAPNTFHGAGVDLDPALYLPFAMQPQVSPQAWDRGKSRLTNGNTWWVRILGRIRPGVTNAQASAALDGVFRQTAVATLPHPGRVGSESMHLLVAPGDRGDARRTSDEFAPVAFGLSALAGLVLILACVNLANLLLARAATRRRELSVRMALGARRARIARQMLTESMMLAVLGGGAGIAIAYAGRNVLPEFLRHQPVAFDWRVSGFAVALSLLTGFLFGAIPAWRSAHMPIQRGLQGNARSTADRAHSRLARGLVVLQVFLSMILLIGSGLFVRTVRNLLHAPLGFEPHHLLLFEIELPSKSYPTPLRVIAAFQQIEQRLSAIPGVRSVSLSEDALIDNHRWTTNFDPTGQPKGKTIAWTNIVGENFFRTMEIPLLSGRDFSSQDTVASPPVAIVNQELARTFFPDRDPIGLTFNSPPTRIIGVVANFKSTGLRQIPPPTYYLPESQYGRSNDVTFELRTAASPLLFADAARRAVHAFDPQLPVATIRTQQEQIEESILNERAFALLTSAFGLLALALACIGIYGIMAYAVSQRTSEIGIRIALGAEPRRVRAMVLREASWMAFAGIVAGAAGALALGKLIASMLYGVTPRDTLTLAASAALLLAVTLASGWIPARRAAAVNPIQALRHE